MRLLIVAALVVAPLVLPASASPCMPEQPCPTCPYVLVIDGKNTHLEHAQC